MLGGVSLTWLGFTHSLWLMAAALGLVLLAALIFLNQDMGKSKKKVKFTQLFSKSREINWLSASRFFLFASRDVWFVSFSNRSWAGALIKSVHSWPLG